MDKSYNAVLGIIFSCVHEIGHIGILLLKQVKLKEISFGLINIDIMNEDLQVKPENQILVFLGGPLINLILSFIFAIICVVSPNYIFKIMSLQNLILGFINLLPIKTLDGGKILYVLLSQCIELNKAETITNLISIIFLIPLCILGFIIFVKSKYNFSLLILACYLVSYILYK